MTDQPLVRMQPHITYRAADAALRAAVQAAAAAGVRVGICVTDANGSLVTYARMDGAPAAADQGAKGKAVLAAALGRSTADFIETRLKQDEVLWRAMAANSDVFIVPGGIALRFDGATVGGVGVSGAKHEQDAQVAQAAADHFERSAGAAGGEARGD